MLTRTKAVALYGVTLLIFASMTPVRWWLESKIGIPFQIPDLMFGLDPSTLATFKFAMMLPVGDWTGGDWFKWLHTYTLDLVLPALTGLSFAVFFLRAGQQLPRFRDVEPRAKWMAAFIVGFPCVMVDYMENFQVWKLITSSNMPNQQTASTISVLTTLKFACLVFAFSVCAAFFLATLKTRKTT